MLLKLSRKTEIQVGALGRRVFASGYWLYVGSAQRALTARVERHRRPGRKRLHWHIDYLRRHATWIASFPIRGHERRESAIAERF